MPKPLETVKAAPQKAVPKGTSTTAIRTKIIASRSVSALRGDLIRMRIPAAVATFWTASKASQCQCVQRRPVRLLRRQKMSARGGECIGPPLPSGDEQQNGNKNRVRGKKERDFAVGETKGPGDLRGDVIANGGREDEAHRAEKCAGASLWFGDHLRFEFPLGRRFTLPPCTHRVSAAAVLADGRLAVENRWFSAQRGRLPPGIHATAFEDLV